MASSEKFVKLVSKKDEWYDEGTEVFDASICDWGRIHKRMTVEHFEKNWKPSGQILGLGLRNGFWDEELCLLEEFDISIVEEQIY